MTLIQRLEALTEPSREVDLAISIAINYRGMFDKTDWKFTSNDGEIGSPSGGILCARQFVPDWTESLAAALTLFADEETAFRALYEVMCWFATEGPIFKPTIFALNKALCIAALKARGVK